MRSVLVALAVLAVTATAEAHPMDVGYLRIAPHDETLAIEVDVDVAAVAAVVGGAPGDVTSTSLRATAGAFAAQTYARAAISTPDGPCTWGTHVASAHGRTARFVTTARCPSASGTRTWRFPFIPASTISGTFELLVKQTIAGTETLTLVDRYAPQIEIAGAPRRSWLRGTLPLGLAATTILAGLVLLGRRRRARA